MAEEFYSLVTNTGLSKQLESLETGLPFEITQIALGDGNGTYYEPSKEQTKLVNEVWRGNIETCEWSDDRFYCVTTVPADVGEFTVREAGVFDSGNNLIVISKFPETIKQTSDTGTVKQLTIRIEMLLTNDELAELVVNPNIQMVTKSEVEETLGNFQAISEKGIPNGYAPIDENGLIPEEYIPEIETKSLLTPFCLNSCKLDTKGNPDLLSSKTVKVAKYTSSILGVFYTALDTVLEKDVVVYADTELKDVLSTIVVIDEETGYISFGEIETLSEDEENLLHYSGSVTGDFYIQETLEVGTECYSDEEYTDLIGVVTYLNLTKICISNDETYTLDGNVTTHIYITAAAPFTYTTALSKTHTVEDDLVLDVIDLCPEDGESAAFNLFVSNDGDEYSLLALQNEIFTQMLEPDDYSINDIWFRILEPLASYIYLLNVWQETNLVPIGVFSLEGGEE
ncbi:MAG: phage tail protein [Candidatus Gastranaerophilales bacterium]|nr:phage tail protein [Candidatus Gastranaerophilales bacterium]